MAKTRTCACTNCKRVRRPNDSMYRRCVFKDRIARRPTDAGTPGRIDVLETLAMWEAHPDGMNLSDLNDWIDKDND